MGPPLLPRLRCSGGGLRAPAVAAEEQSSLVAMAMLEQMNSEEPAAGTLSQWQLQLHSTNTHPKRRGAEARRK